MLNDEPEFSNVARSFTAVTVESIVLTTSRGSSGLSYFWLLLVAFLLQNNKVPFPTEKTTSCSNNKNATNDVQNP